MRAVIWSKNNCILCTKAKISIRIKELVMKKEILKMSPSPWTPEDFFKAVPNARTFPQIEIDGKMIGGYDMMMITCAI